MMSAASIKVALVLSVILAGGSLKVSRYAASEAAIPADAVDKIVWMMSAHGWSLVPQSDSATATLYDHLGFEKTGCATRVTIAAMGGNAEAAEFFRQRYHGDAAFIQGGDVVERPSGVRRQIAILTAHARPLLGLDAPPVMPILAVSPAPLADQGECAGPPSTAWRWPADIRIQPTFIAKTVERSAEVWR